MIVIWDPSKNFRGKLARALEGFDDVLGDADLRGVAEESDASDHLDSGDILLVGPDVESKKAIAATRRLAPEGIGVVILKSDPTAAFMRAAMRAGVRDVIPASSKVEQIASSLRAASKSVADRSASNEPGKVIVVFSAKGGCGKSFVSSNLAVLLAQQTGESVALVDLDFDSGDQQIMLQLFEGQSFLDISQDAATLDPDSIRSAMAVHESGVHLLAAPAEPGQSEMIPPEFVHHALQVLRRAFRYVVVDGPTTYTEHLMAALEDCDEWVLVTSMDVPSIRSLKVSLQTLDTLGVDHDKVKVLLNRADSDVGLRPAEIEKTLGRKVDIRVPSSKDVPMSINRGVPIAVTGPRSPVTDSLRPLAGSISGTRSTKTAPKSRARSGARGKKRLMKRKEHAR